MFEKISAKFRRTASNVETETGAGKNGKGGKRRKGKLEKNESCLHFWVWLCLLAEASSGIVTAQRQS